MAKSKTPKPKKPAPKKSGKPKASKSTALVPIDKSKALVTVDEAEYRDVPPPNEPDNFTDDGEFDPIHEANKKEISAEFRKLLEDVGDLKTMTDTRFFRGFFKSLDTQYVEARKALETADGKDVVRCQMVIKTIREIKNLFAEPCARLNQYRDSNPLFAQQMRYHAEWNASIGKVQMKKI